MSWTLFTVGFQKKKSGRTVSRILLPTLSRWSTIIHLGIPSPESSSNLSEAQRRAVLPHIDLALDRVCRPSGYPEWGQLLKLTFHPVAERIQHGLLSVTLSVALRPPVFHWYPLLQSPDFPLLP